MFTGAFDILFPRQNGVARIMRMYLQPNPAQFGAVVQKLHFEVHCFRIAGIQKQTSMITDRSMENFDVNQTLIVNVSNQSFHHNIVTNPNRRKPPCCSSANHPAVRATRFANVPPRQLTRQGHNRLTQVLFDTLLLQVCCEKCFLILM